MASKRVLLGLAVGAGAIAAGASPATAAIQCVGGGPAGVPCAANYATIQEAVTAAAANAEPDTIAVAPGNFAGPVVASEANLIFRGSRFNVSAPSRTGPETVITGGLSVSGAAGVRVDGFTFSGAGIAISNAVGANNPAGNGQVTNNIFDGGGVGLAIDASPSAAGTPFEVTRNVFQNQAEAGVRVTGTTELDIRDNALGRNPSAGVLLNGGNTNVRIFRNSVRPNALAGVVLAGSPNTGTQVVGNTIAGLGAGSSSVGVRIDAAGAGPGTRIAANRLIANPVGDVVAPDGVGVDATGNWWGQNAGPRPGDVIGNGINAGGHLRLAVTATPAEIAANGNSAVSVAMITPSGQPEPAFPPTVVLLSTSLGTLRDNDTPPAQGPSIATGLTAGAGAAVLSPGAPGTATITARLDSQSLATPVRVGPAAGGGGGGGGGNTAAALRLRLSVVAGRKARVRSRVVFGLRANRVVRRQRVQLQRAVRQRVRGRTRIVYRNVAVRTINGRTARITVRFSRAGRYALRAAYRDRGRLRRTNAVGITVRARLR